MPKFGSVVMALWLSVVGITSLASAQEVVIAPLVATRSFTNLDTRATYRFDVAVADSEEEAQQAFDTMVAMTFADEMMAELGITEPLEAVLIHPDLPREMQKGIEGEIVTEDGWRFSVALFVFREGSNVFFWMEAINGGNAWVELNELYKEFEPADFDEIDETNVLELIPSLTDLPAGTTMENEEVAQA